MRPPLTVGKFAVTTFSTPVSPRISRCFLCSSAHSPPACRSAFSSLASVDAPTHTRRRHALCVLSRNSCCDPQSRASSVAHAAALAATSSLASRGDATRTQTDSGGRPIAAVAVTGPAGARRIAFMGGGCLPRGRHSCLFMAGVEMKEAAATAAAAPPPARVQVDLTECHHRQQPLRGAPLQVFHVGANGEQVPTTSLLEERVGLCVMQVMWEACGCEERVAQWDTEPHVSRRGASKVIIQLVTHVPPHSQQPPTLSATSPTLLSSRACYPPPCIPFGVVAAERAKCTSPPDRFGHGIEYRDALVETKYM